MAALADSEKTITDLQAQLADATTKRDELQTQCDDLTAKVEALADSEKTITDLQAQLADVTAKRDELQTQCDDLAAQVEALKDAGDKLESVKGELADAKDALKAMTAERDQLQSRVDQLTAALDQATQPPEGDETQTTQTVSQEMSLNLTLPEGATAMAFNGGLMITRDDGTAQAQLNLWADENGAPYTPDTMDIAQLLENVMQSMFPNGDRPEAAATETPEGWRFQTAGEDGQTTDVWLCKGPSRLYCLETVGDADAAGALADAIAAGLQLW